MSSVIQQTSYGLASESQPGLVQLPISARSIVGDTSGTAVPAGRVGQEAKTTVTAAVTGSAVLANYTQISTLELTAGRWHIVANVPYVSIAGAANDTGATIQGLLASIKLRNTTDGIDLIETPLPGLAKSSVNSGYLVTSGNTSIVIDLSESKTIQLSFAAVANSGTPTLTALTANMTAGRPSVLRAIRIA